MNQLEYAIEICRRLSERRVPSRLWIGDGEDPEIVVHRKGMSITRVGTKAFDLAQLREVYKQLITELNANGWTQDAHRLVLRLGEGLSSNPSSTPSSPDEGDQAEGKSGWQNPDSELHAAFRPGEARRGLRDAAAQSKGLTRGDLRLREILLPLEEARAKAGLAEALAQRKALDKTEASSRETRAAFDALGSAIERKKFGRGKASP